MKLVVDASVAIAAAATPLGFERLRAFDLIAPPLLWIESESVLHATLWRGELRRDQAQDMRTRLARRRSHRTLPTTYQTVRGRLRTPSAGRRPTTPTTSRSHGSGAAAW